MRDSQQILSNAGLVFCLLFSPPMWRWLRCWSMWHQSAISYLRAVMNGAILGWSWNQVQSTMGMMSFPSRYSTWESKGWHQDQCFLCWRNWRSSLPFVQLRICFPKGFLDCSKSNCSCWLDRDKISVLCWRVCYCILSTYTYSIYIFIYAFMFVIFVWVHMKVRWDSSVEVYKYNKISRSLSFSVLNLSIYICISYIHVQTCRRLKCPSLEPHFKSSEPQNKLSALQWVI